MSVQFIDKQRQGVNVIKTALLSVGIRGRSVCVQVSSWVDQYGCRVEYAAFVGAPPGSNIEPFYTTGNTLAEAVRNMIVSVKGRVNGAKTEVSEIAPF